VYITELHTTVISPSPPTYLRSYVLTFFLVDVFGTRFQKELEQLKKDVARWQEAPLSPRVAPTDEKPKAGAEGHQRDNSLNNIEPLNMKTTTSARELVKEDGIEVRERNVTITTTTSSLQR
jgi:hypothetical protein